MNINEIATKGDIEEILKAIEKLEEKISNTKVQPKFLRSSGVRKLLDISDGTLQRLRESQTLYAKKVNGTWFYKYEDIEKLITEKK